MEGFQQRGAFMVRDGLAKERGMKDKCKKRVFFFTTYQGFLEETLFQISNANDCYDVKYSIQTKDGVCLGICSFTNESSVGDMWAKYESHPNAWVSIQDDEFCETYKSLIRTY